MRSYTHITLEERESLRIKLCQGKSLRQIATEMGRNVSSISRELKRNRQTSEDYKPWLGCIRYLYRRRRSHRPNRLDKDKALLHFICQGLDQYWSPEIIAAKWNQQRNCKSISHSTIYSALKKKYLNGYTERSHLRRRGILKFCKGNNATIHPDHTIADRPNVINLRERIGDWEADTVLGGVGRGGLLTCLDRKTRYLVIRHVKGRTAIEMQEAMCAALKDMPLHSITLDNGSEFARFRQIEKILNTTIYFANPHSPWQRGSNENVNGLLRWFFPKGYDFHQVTQQQLKLVENLINNRPRKCLGWLSPAEAMRCCT